MAGLTPLPPHVQHTTTRLTHAEAHTLLSAFLSESENNAAYRPDATLAEGGPTSATTGANPNLTLHHLKRILQGMEGKRIGGEDVGQMFGEIGGTRRKRDDEVDGFKTGSAKKPRRELVEDGNAEDSGPGVAVGEEQDGWQDKDDFELAQEDGGLELTGDQRHPGVELGQPIDENEAKDIVGVEVEDTGVKVDPRRQGKETTVDKAARKAAKKARHKQERKNKENTKPSK